MALWFEPTDEHRAGWEAWLANRPEAARSLLRNLAPWDLYQQPSTGVIVTFHGLKTEGDGQSFSIFVNIIGHVEHSFSSPYYGAYLAEPGELLPYEPRSLEELMMLAHRASGGGSLNA